jgi:hypothetical protein
MKRETRSGNQEKYLWRAMFFIRRRRGFRLNGVRR